MGDIGSHAENLAEYITGLKITEICADLTSFVDGRILDDDGNCLLRFENGARGILHASQVCAGRENDLKIWIYGEDKSLEWHQEDPNKLIVRSIDEPMQIWTRGNDYVASASPAAARASRLPGGHPEAFLEAFANNYSNFAEAIFCQIEGREPGELDLDFPDVNDGLRGMIFIETVVKAGKNDEVKWVKFEN
jgi:predicted dehydrogenase